MDTIADIELVLSGDLKSEETCESPFHSEHINGHRDGNALWYVQFFCGCASMGITLRCGSWVKTARARPHWNCALCKQDVETKDWFTVLSYIDKRDET